MDSFHDIGVVALAGAVSGGLASSVLFKFTDLDPFMIYLVVGVFSVAAGVAVVYFFDSRIGFS